MVGHCSKCGKIWTLETEQGVCQWCGKPSTCQSTRTQALRNLKSRSNGRKRQAPTIGNGYDQLIGDWLLYYKVASPFSYKAKVEDREDLLHDIMIALADVARNNGHKPLTEPAMYRVASITRADYWRTQYKHTNGLDCGSCSKAQRKECRKDWLYSECPKAIKLEYLDKPIIDTDGNLTELGDLIADDHAIDLDAWLDAKTFLLGCPQRLIGIAHKRRDGIPLNEVDRRYFNRQRQKELDEMCRLLQRGEPLIVLVFNFIDTLITVSGRAHIDDIELRRFVRERFRISSEAQLIQEARRLDYLVFITSDHGNTLVKQTVAVEGAEKLEAPRSRLMELVRPPKHPISDTLLINEPQKWGLPPDKCYLLATCFLKFDKLAGKDINYVVHGGISTQEMVVPLVRIGNEG